jgi:hypothetical protein
VVVAACVELVQVGPIYLEGRERPDEIWARLHDMNSGFAVNNLEIVSEAVDAELLVLLLAGSKWTPRRPNTSAMLSSPPGLVEAGRVEPALSYVLVSHLLETA